MSRWDEGGGSQCTGYPIGLSQHRTHFSKDPVEAQNGSVRSNLGNHHRHQRLTERHGELTIAPDEVDGRGTNIEHQDDRSNGAQLAAPPIGSGVRE